MSETAHAFNPTDSSLKARIDAYRTAYKDWLNAEASQKFLADDEWADSPGDIGDIEEVMSALDISTRSLEMAAESFSSDDIQKAISQDLLSKEKARGLIENKRLRERQKLRDSQTHTSIATSSSLD